MNPAIEHILQFFKADHLPDDLRAVSQPFATLAHDLVNTNGGHGLEGPEATVGLRKLLEAKDCFVRAMLAKRQQMP